MSNNTEFDVVISGGGLSGLLTAIGLLNEAPSLSIAIIEPFQSPTVDAQNQQSNTEITSNFDDRCLALSHGSLQLLNHWQIWQQLKPSAWPIKHIITSDRGHFGKTIMRAEQYGLNAMGYVAAMKNMGAAFTQTLGKIQQQLNSKITWFCPDSVSEIVHQIDKVELTLSSKQQISAKLFVVAEGANSSSRELLKIASSTEHYNQNAIITNVQVNTSQKLDKNTAFERFTTSGPIAFLPISEHQYSVVWSVKPDEVEPKLNLSELEFISHLQQAFGFSAGKIIKASKPTAFPLVLTKAQHIIAERTVLIGNSAHTIHPIAGQGFNLGIRDVGVLVNLVKTATENKHDIGGFAVLNDYQQLREKDINRIANFTDMLVRVFGLEGRLPAAVRTVGLMTMQKCSTLQQWFALNFMSSKQTQTIREHK